MKAGDVFYPIVSVRQYGLPVTGLAAAAFSVAASVASTTSAPTVSSCTELGGGDYRLALTSVGTAGWQNYTFTCTAGVCYPNRLAGWVSAQDADSIYGIAVRPVAVQSATGSIASSVSLVGNANRYTPYTISVTDQTGAAYDLSGFNNFRFTVWDRNHAATAYSLSGGAVTGSAGGVLAWNVPETASYFSLIDAAIAAGTDPLTLYYDVIADAAATASKTETIIYGTLTLYRYEGAA